MNKSKYINFAITLVVTLYLSLPSLCYCAERPADDAQSPSRTITFYTYNNQIANEADQNGFISSYLGRDVRSVINLYPKTGDSSLVNIDYMIKNGKDFVGETNDNGTTLKNVRQYSPYGKIVDSSSSTLELETPSLLPLFSNPYGYSGYYTDSESGVYYLNARYYSPELMRFISRDSYDLPNRYAYADNNPIANVDPSGHISLSFMHNTWWGEYIISAMPVVGPTLLAIDGWLSKQYAEMILGTALAPFDVVGGSTAGGIGAKIAYKHNYENNAVDILFSDLKSMLQDIKNGIKESSSWDKMTKELFESKLVNQNSRLTEDDAKIIKVIGIKKIKKHSSIEDLDVFEANGKNFCVSSRGSANNEFRGQNFMKAINDENNHHKTLYELVKEHNTDHLPYLAIKRLQEYTLLKQQSERVKSKFLKKAKDFLSE